MRIVINGNRHQEGHFREIETLISTLVSRGHDVILSDRFLEYLTSNLGPRFPLGLLCCHMNRVPEADIAISIGGDGAFLKTARWVSEGGIPVVGINTGHLGYLSAFTFENADEIYDTLLAGSFRIEERSMLSIEVTDGNTTRSCTALNEVAFTRDDGGQMLNISAIINDCSSLDFLGDGIIISTPTGSTAYNLSVGGPILDPQLRGWAIAPIAAHSLSMRPLVVCDSSVIRIKVTSRSAAFRMNTDGKSMTLNVGADIIVRRAPHPLRIILQAGHSFTDTLRDKLGLGNPPGR